MTSNRSKKTSTLEAIVHGTRGRDHSWALHFRSPRMRLTIRKMPARINFLVELGIVEERSGAWYQFK